MAAPDQAADADTGAEGAVQKSPAAEQEAKGESSASGVFRRHVYRIVFQGRTVFRFVDDGGAGRPPGSHSSASTAASASLTGEVRRVVPGWVQALAAGHHRDHGNDGNSSTDNTRISFLMSKELIESDLDHGKNSVGIPADAAENNIIPILTDEERKAAVVRRHSSKKKRERRSRREHGRGGGLPVSVYTRSGWRFALVLKCSRSKKHGITAAALEGTELEAFSGWSFFKAGDRVEMWAFRVDGQLRLALGKSQGTGN